MRHLGPCPAGFAPLVSPVRAVPIIRVAALLFGVLVAAGTPSSAAAPGEVTGLKWADGRTLVWDSIPLVEGYNVYRGYIRNLAPDYFGTAFEAELTTTSLQDETVPAHGWGLFYLVTATGEGGEGTMGSGLAPGGASSARPNNYAWPGFGVAGRWEGLREWPGVAIHTALLRTGKVITWQGGNLTQTFIWDPETDTFDVRTAGADLFCAGHTFLPSGKLLAIGGTIFCCPPALGGNWTGLFDPLALTWQEGPFMALGRWYPAGLSLGDGRVLALSGNDQLGEPNPLVEAYTAFGGRPPGTGEWQVLEGATAYLPLYPRVHLLSTGKAFLSAPAPQTFTLDPQTQSWEFVAESQYGFRAAGSSVLLPPGQDRVMIVGGVQGADDDHGPTLATTTAEVIDLSAPLPSWSYTGPMLFPRMHLNLVILPTGKVLAAGGGYNENVSTYPSELYDPAAGTWSVVATMKSFRLYHSTAILLPDGRVMWAGSNDNPTAEFYLPGYLFRGPRPLIEFAPELVLYDHDFTVETPDAAGIASVVLIRPGAVTHSVNMEQRYVPLQFTQGTTSLTVTAPASSNLAPPGFYMLFLVDEDEVPSEAVFLLVR